MLLGHTLTTKITVNGQPTTPALSIFWAENARIDELRTHLVEWALEARSDYILWMDDDHTFPRDALLRLLAHELPMVGCNFRVRNTPTLMETSAFNVVDGERRGLVPKQDGCESVEYLGLGLCLMKAAIFTELPRPWFVMGPRGEDAHICEQLRARGVTPIVDHALSLECGHLSEVDLRLSA
jgi:hypothetical protein